MRTTLIILHLLGLSDNYSNYSVWDILQELLYESPRETYANLHELKKAIRQKWKNGTRSMTKLQKVYFAVEKASSGNHKTRWGPTQHIFSWMLVKAADNWLNTLRFLPRCMECRRGLAMRILSLCPSVSPSVCPSVRQFIYFYLLEWPKCN